MFLGDLSLHPHKPQQVLEALASSTISPPIMPESGQHEASAPIPVAGPVATPAAAHEPPAAVETSAAPSATVRMRAAALAALRYRTSSSSAAAAASDAATSAAAVQDGRSKTAAVGGLVQSLEQLQQQGGAGEAVVMRASNDVYAGRKDRSSDDATYLVCP